MATDYADSRQLRYGEVGKEMKFIFMKVQDEDTKVRIAWFIVGFYFALGACFSLSMVYVVMKAAMYIMKGGE